MQLPGIRISPAADPVREAGGRLRLGKVARSRQPRAL